jgi:hypothetical protein
VSADGLRTPPPAVVALVTCGVAGTTLGPLADSRISDMYLYRSIAGLVWDGHWPYHDFALEYPPLALVPILLARIAGAGETAYAVAFGLLMLACLLVVQAAVVRLCPSRRAANTAAWIVAVSPLLLGALARERFDLLPVAVALVALVALRRDHVVAAFALLGVGALVKLFPAFLAAPIAAWLLARGERRRVATGVAAMAGVIALGSAPFVGPGYVEQVSFHLDRPVQIESAPATVLFALGDSHVTGHPVRPDRFKSNGLDGGPADGVALAFAALLVLALLVVTALAARSGDLRRLVLACTATLLAFVALGKVLSPQFLIWLVPFAALAWAWGARAMAVAIGAAVVLTAAHFPHRYFDLVDAQTGPIVLVGARNVLLLVAVGLPLRSLARSPARSTPPAPAPRT